MPKDQARRLWPIIAGIALVSALSGCASAPIMHDGVLINDPYEATNRRVHDFNKGLDATLIAPVANLVKGRGQARAPGQMGSMDLLANVGANLSLPGKMVNGLLQGRPGPAIRNGFRFAINSTIGIGGLFDPAQQDFGLPESDTDFGETLAVWGVPEGAYTELPLLGPSTRRDAVGKLGDLVLDPWHHVLRPRQAVSLLALRAASKAGDRARFGDTVDSVLRDSADSYAQTRLIWLMHRRHELGEEGEAIDPYDADGIIDPYE